MTQPRRMTVALLAAALALTAAGCGGSSKRKAASTTPTTAVATTTTGTTTTDTTTGNAGKTSTTAKGDKSTHKTSTTDTNTPKPPPLSQTPARVLRYAGMGVLELGTVRIPKDSTITWTNDGQLFQIIPASVKVQSPVNSMAHSGTAQIKKGAYHGFLINAVGHWKVTITPN